MNDDEEISGIYISTMLNELRVIDYNPSKGWFVKVPGNKRLFSVSKKEVLNNLDKGIWKKATTEDLLGLL